MSYRRHERRGKLDLSVISLGLIKQQEYQVRTDDTNLGVKDAYQIKHYSSIKKRKVNEMEMYCISSSYLQTHVHAHSVKSGAAE